MRKLFLVFLSKPKSQTQSNFSFKSKTPLGKGLIKKAFFKGLQKKQHEKKGEKKEFNYRKVLLFITTLLLEPDTPLTACGHPGLQGLMPVRAVLSQSKALVGSNLPMERAMVAPAAVWQALPQVEMPMNHLKMHSCQRSPGPVLTSCSRPSGPWKSFGLPHLFLFSPPKQSGTVIALDSKPKCPSQHNHQEDDT